MMLEKKELNKIKKEIENEFPNDFALQQIHIAAIFLNYYFYHVPHLYG